MKHENIHLVELPDSGVIVASRIKRPFFGSKPHIHNHLSILYVVSGEGMLEIGEKSHQLGADSIVALRKDQMHRFLDKPRKQMTVFSIYFDIRKTKSNQPIADYLFQMKEPFTLPIYYTEQVRRTLRQILHEQSNRPPGYKLGIIELFNLTLLSIYRAKLETTKSQGSFIKNDSQQRVHKALEHISRNSHEPFTLSDAARMAKVSQRQFTNLCRKQTGSSFKKFLNQQRCRKAQRLITDTEMSIASIAFEVGYEELSTFYRAFRSIYHTSPLKIRNSTI